VFEVLAEEETDDDEDNDDVVVVGELGRRSILIHCQFRLGSWRKQMKKNSELEFEVGANRFYDEVPAFLLL
jgi:hypothetical protein